MDRTSIMFSGLLLISGIIWECSSTATAPSHKDTQVGLPLSDSKKGSSIIIDENNYGQQTPWRPIIPPAEYTSQAPVGRIGAVPHHPIKYFTPTFPKNTVNFKIDSMGYPMDVKTFIEPGFKKYQGPKLSELNFPKYNDIISRLNTEQVPKITPNTRNTRESYNKPYDFPKSTEFNSNFNTKIKPYSSSSQYPVNSEYPSHLRGFPSKLTNFGKESFNTDDDDDDKFQGAAILAGYKSSGTMKIPQLKINNNSNRPNNPSVKSNEQYQLLTSQPQLHFQSSGLHSPMVYPSPPFQRIRADVEVINKKRPVQNNNDNKSEEDFGSAGESLEESKHPVLMQNGNPFDMPESNIFESYDQTFGNYSNKIPKRPVVTPVVETPAQQFGPDSGSVEDNKKNLEYEENNDSSAVSQEKYDEDEDEAETRKNERRYSEKNSDAYKNYGADFEREFEESYKRQVPRETYKHVKEVPEIDEPVKRNKNKYATKKDDDNSPQRIKKYYKTVTQRNAPKQYNRYVTYHSDDPTKSDSEIRGTERIIQQSASPVFGSKIIKQSRQRDNSSNKIEMKIHHQNQRSIDDSKIKARGNLNETTRAEGIESVKRIMVDVDPPSGNPLEKMKPPFPHSYPGYYDDIYNNPGWKHIKNK